MRESIKNRIDAVRRGEVPEGYKKAYPYIIPDDWHVVKLGTICARTSRPNRDGKERPAYSINNKKGFIPQNEQFEEGSYQNLDKTAYKIVKKGEFAYNPARVNVGSIGRLRDETEVIVSSLYVCVSVNSAVDGEYFDAWTKTDDFYKETVRNTEGSVREYLFYENFANMRMPIPPLAEQQKIAEILATCDRVIELKQKLLEEMRRQKQWLMQKLLDPSSGVRLPGFERSEWIETPLSDLCEFVGGGTPDTSNDEYWHGTIPWISSADLQEGNIRCINATRYITEEAVNNSATKICPENSILIVSRVGVGKIAIAPTALCTSQDFINLVDVKGNLYFVTLQLQREIQRILSMSQGTSIKGIASKEIKAMVIELPARDEQDTIANVLESSDREITLIETEIKAWQQKKKAIMQLLLTGLARVNA